MRRLIKLMLGLVPTAAEKRRDDREYEEVMGRLGQRGLAHSGETERAKTELRAARRWRRAVVRLVVLAIFAAVTFAVLAAVMNDRWLAAGADGLAVLLAGLALLRGWRMGNRDPSR